MYHKASENNNKEIKIVLQGGLGDHLLVTPFIRFFKESGEYKQITCSVEATARQIFDKNPFIDKLSIHKAGHYLFEALPDKSVDLFTPGFKVSLNETGGGVLYTINQLIKGNLSSISITKKISEFYNINLKSYDLKVYTIEEDQLWANQYIKKFSGKPFVILHGTSPLEEKRLSKSIYDGIINGLKDTFYIVEIDSGSFVCQQLDHKIPYPEIRQFIELSKRAHCIISSDSFPGHVAAATNTPGIILFGPTNPLAYGHAQNYNFRDPNCEVCANSPRRKLCKKAVCMERFNVNKILDTVKSARR